MYYYQNYQVNQASSYSAAAELALSNNDFHPFRQELYTVQGAEASTLNNNNSKVDLGCVKNESLQSELKTISEDLSCERSIGARSTMTFGK